MANAQSSKKFCTEVSTVENRPRCCAETDSWMINCAHRSNDHNPARDRITAEMKTPKEARGKSEAEYQRQATAGVSEIACHDKNHIPARTGPILDMSIGAANVELSSKTVATIRRIPTMPDVSFGSDSASKKVVI